jgi:hypothetical protein
VAHPMTQGPIAQTIMATAANAIKRESRVSVRGSNGACGCVVIRAVLSG